MPKPAPTPAPVADGPQAIALFQDNNPDALAVSGEWIFHKDLLHKFVLKFQMPAGTTSPTTFKIRAGGSYTGNPTERFQQRGSPGRITFNGVNGARLFGNKLYSSITVKERTP